MRVALIIAVTIISLIYSCTNSFGQGLNIDSCGLDASPILNKHEILFVDSFLFKPYSTKKTGVIDPKNGFGFTSKKIVFYSCTIDANTKGKGVISKQTFFGLLKPAAHGHLGFNLIKFTEAEQAVLNGFEAAIVIDCPYTYVDKKELIPKILAFYR